ncbi:DUF6702 family protein [Psychroserpens luteus]|uniref:DUF6702 family protein n=1 Tax=Psychroserpens luteus TaxID=1434066 RepID=A0ABW5ZUC2_9FLAO|nr:DUF6702 family protein [Psychroserpens luteus]
MLQKFIIVVFLLIGISMNAHQPASSTTMLVEKEDSTWVLQISASLTAFQQEVRTHFAETPYKTLEEFQQMVIEHIKNNLDITINDNQTITLSSGIVKLGHETKVVFEVFGVPSEIKSITFKNSAFQDIYNNQSALILLKEGFDREHFVLNNKNNHTLNLNTEANKFVVEANNEASVFSPNLFFILFGILAVAFLSKIIISRKNEKQ